MTNKTKEDCIKRLSYLVSLDEASALTGIAVKTFRNWRSRGAYRNIFVKIGGCLRIDLLEFAKVIGQNVELTRANAKRAIKNGVKAKT